MNQLTQSIVHHIPQNAKVLDLGCGDGTLLSTLIKKKECTGYGIDFDHECIVTCTKKGISAFQGNIEDGLSAFSDQSFDMVILSQTLQQVNAPLDLIRSMLRIGKKVIVTFPNFAHWTIRLSLLFGYIPKSKSLPYEWYNTPNIRVISIHSFKKMCKKNNIRIVEEISLFAPGLINTLFSKGFPNYFCDRGMFIIERG